MRAEISDPFHDPGQLARAVRPLWYVTNATTRMDLRTQVAKRYRPDGTTYQVNGVSQVLQACTAAYAPNPVPPQTSAFLDANDAQNNMHNRVVNASLSVHTGTSTSFSIWRHAGAGYWQFDTVAVQH